MIYDLDEQDYEKECNTCGDILPNTRIFFSVSVRHYDGLRNICKRCDAERSLLTYYAITRWRRLSARVAHRGYLIRNPFFVMPYIDEQGE